MNIFALDPCPVRSAQLMCDQHVVKMPLETAQILVAVMARYGWQADDMPCTKSGTPYRVTHANHPCTVWAGDSGYNLHWTVRHGLALCDEYTIRFGKVHASESAIRHANELLRVKGPYLFGIDDPGSRVDSFAVAIPQDTHCRRLQRWEHLDAHGKYQAYYALDKDFARWTRSKRGVPAFVDLFRRIPVDTRPASL